MEVNDASGVKVYNVSAGKTVPEWLQEKKKGRSLRKDAGTITTLTLKR